MDREAAVISWGVEPATAFIVSWIVGWNNSLPDPALFRVESLQPPACRLGHAVRHFAAGGDVLADYASIGHAGNLTREPGSREPLFRRRRTPSAIRAAARKHFAISRKPVEPIFTSSV